MAKVTSKNGIILVGGYALSPNLSSYEVDGPLAEPIDVTGFTEGSQNYTPGMLSGKVTLNAYWNNAAGTVTEALKTAGNKIVTIIPEGYALGNSALSLNGLSNSFSPSGVVTDAIKVESIEFNPYGNYYAVMPGWMLAHATITNTATGTGVLDPSDAAVTAVCAGVLHIWDACPSDTYEVKIQHSTDDNTYADLITFTLTGAALGAEIITVASGTVNKYRRVVATRTGAAGDNFGYSVFFWHA